MIRILCFGDSNTWGYNPMTKQRFDHHTRWPRVMEQALIKHSHTLPKEQEIEVIEEGMNGRTTVWDDPIDGLMSGYRYLKPCLLSHKPLDWVIIMLGTNDLKDRFSVSAFDIAKSTGRLVQYVQSSTTGANNTAPNVLLLTPPPIVESQNDNLMTRQSGIEKSMIWEPHFASIAKEYDCAYYNVGNIIHSSSIDGVHFTANSHIHLGQHLAKLMQKLIRENT